MKAVVAAFNQKMALVGAFSVIMNLRMELFQALAAMSPLLRLALGGLLASAASAQQQLGLDIFYESLCPDSTR